MEFSDERTPRIQISASFTSDVCHKSGSPPFSVQLSFHNCEDFSVTLHTGDWIFKLPTALQTPRVSFRDAQDGTIVPLAQIHMCGCSAKGWKPGPKPECFISIPARQKYTYGAVVNATPTHPLMDDWLRRLEPGRSYQLAIEEDIALKWWTRGTKEEMLKYIEKPEILGSSEESAELHETPIVLELTGNANPSFTVAG